MTHRFTNLQREVYLLRRERPPTNRGSGGLAAAYFRGLEHPEKPSHYGKTSLAYAAWCAGAEAAAENAGHLTAELRRNVRICSLSDPLLEMIHEKSQAYIRAGMIVSSKDVAGWVISFLIERTEEVR